MVIRKATPPQDNLRKDQRRALKEFQNMEDVAILPADKGNATVVMSLDDYDEKLTKMLSTGTYCRIDKDPTQTQETRFARYLKRLEKTSQLYRRIRPTGSRPPLLYGLHITDVPLRPIVACIGSPSYGLSKFVATLISPLAGPAALLRELSVFPSFRGFRHT